MSYGYSKPRTRGRDETKHHKVGKTFHFFAIRISVKRSV